MPLRHLCRTRVLSACPQLQAACSARHSSELGCLPSNLHLPTELPSCLRYERPRSRKKGRARQAFQPSGFEIAGSISGFGPRSVQGSPARPVGHTETGNVSRGSAIEQCRWGTVGSVSGTHFVSKRDARNLSVYFYVFRCPFWRTADILPRRLRGPQWSFLSSTKNTWHY